MSGNQYDVVVIGGGAAGIAAARHLHDHQIDVLLLEARSRLGGRAFTVRTGGFPLDLGCGWLHSADRNEWTAIAERQGFSVDKSPPPWSRPALGFPASGEKAFRRAMAKFYERLREFSEGEVDVPAARFAEARGPWNPLMNALYTYISGAELDKISARDLFRYDDTDENWRIVEGYGTVIAAHAAQVPVRLGLAARKIDRGDSPLTIETEEGNLRAQAAIITLPSNLLAAESLRISPPLPEKIEAAASLPLGLADKLYFTLSQTDDLPADSRAFGKIDSSETAAYHFRPMGRPLIEAYFGGTLAKRLEEEGEPAFHSFAAGELRRLFGESFTKKLNPLPLHLWGRDPHARGSYSYAMPGKADARVDLAAPVDDRLFFAGEACSQRDFSTAHGAYRTGIAAATQAMQALQRRPSKRIAELLPK
jgi:monoamine oxidase